MKEKIDFKRNKEKYITAGSVIRELKYSIMNG